MISALVVLASLAASGSMTLEPCDIAVDVVHSTPWGFGPTHEINGGWFYVPQYNAVHWRAISATNDPKRIGPRLADSDTVRIQGVWQNREKTRVFVLKVRQVQPRSSID